MNQKTTIKHAYTAAKFAAGMSLALLTMNLAAAWIYDLPCAPSSLFGDVHQAGRRFHQRIEGNGSGVFTFNCVRRATLPVPGQKPVVLALGNSYVEATQVGDDQHFAHLLEQRLGGSPVLPVGVSSYSVADYIVKAPAFKKLFQPDWVIIPVRAASFGTNAWNSNKGGGYAFFTRMNHASQTTTPDFQLNAEAAVADGSVQVFSVPLSKPGWLSSMIRTKCPFWYPLLDFTYLRKAEMEAWIAGHDRPWFHGAVGAPNVDQQTVDETKGYPLKKEMKLLAKAYDGRLTLLFLPKFDPRDPAKEMESEKTLHRLADKAGVRFVSLREKFPALAEAGHAPYGFGNTRFNSGHWNCYAHEAAADLLFEELRQLDSLRKLAASIADAPKRIDLPEAREISVLSPQRTEGLE